MSEVPLYRFMEVQCAMLGLACFRGGHSPPPGAFVRWCFGALLPQVRWCFGALFPQVFWCFIHRLFLALDMAMISTERCEIHYDGLSVQYISLFPSSPPAPLVSFRSFRFFELPT